MKATLLAVSCFLALPLIAQDAPRGLLLANEDHLIMIPSPILDGSDGGEIFIVNKPMISGYGADFEGKCGLLAAPYFVDVRSPSSKVSEVDMNTVSLAKIKLSAGLGPDDNNVCKVAINYSNATEDSKGDVRLLRAILTCVYMFGDSLHGHLLLLVNLRPPGATVKP